MRALWSGLSIQRKSSVLIGGLVLVVAATYSSAAYDGMRRTMLATADERLRSVTDQLAGLLQNSSKQLITLTRTTAADTAVRAFLRSPGTRTRERATAALRRIADQTKQVAEVRLWDAHRRRVFNVMLNGPGAGELADTTVLLGASGPDSGAIGRFRAVGDSVLFPVAVLVVDRGGGRLLGYMTEWRRVNSTPRARDQTNRLIGSKSTLYMGNLAGDVWTDLTRAVPRPPVDVQEAHTLQRYERAGVGTMLVAASPVAGTPWAVVVEFPRSEVLAPARAFLRRLALIAPGLLLVGLFGAWLLSRGITAPLSRLTGAAEAIAAGDYSRRIELDRRDELGRLEQAFTTMVANVREAQRKLEDKVRERTVELEDRNEELEAFGYTISHDLRAPLRAMFGFSQALLEDYGDRLDDKGREYAQRVVTGAQSMDQLIRDLLAYSRVSRAELKLGRVDLSRVLREATTQLQVEVRNRGARVRVEEPLPAVLGHEATLGQVVANLLSNGIKFVAPDRTPELRIRAELREGKAGGGEAGGGADGGWRLRLWVEDNGIGIATEHHERIFRVFERLHSTEAYPGTGIGLAIVRKGMERMGGRAGVESRPGDGSRFWIELPAAEQTHDQERQYDSAG
jgi:signal transduction histidine kinase